VIGCYDSSFLISQMTLTPVFGTGQSREEKPRLLRSLSGEGPTIPDVTPAGFVSLMTLIDPQKDHRVGGLEDPGRATGEQRRGAGRSWRSRIALRRSTTSASCSNRVEGIGDVKPDPDQGRKAVRVGDGAGWAIPTPASARSTASGRPEPPNPSLVKFGPEMGKTYVSLVEVRKGRPQGDRERRADLPVEDQLRRHGVEQGLAAARQFRASGWAPSPARRCSTGSRSAR